MPEQRVKIQIRCDKSTQIAWRKVVAEFVDSEAALLHLIKQYENSKKLQKFY